MLDPKSLYFVALLEENKLKGVTPGNAVTIRVDAYPNQKYKGVVSQVLPASAATFALAPRDISAGEFTKVAQRIPVRIDITDGDISVLQVGLSGEVEIRRKGS
ncbi:MAG: HlyD family secretion protein [Pseudomonadota bacterium]